MRRSSLLCAGIVMMLAVAGVAEHDETKPTEPRVREYAVEFLKADRDPVPGELWARSIEGRIVGQVQVNFLEVPFEAKHMSGYPGTSEFWIVIPDGWSPTVRLFETEDRSFLRVPIYPVRQVTGRLESLALDGAGAEGDGGASLPSFVVARFRQVDGTEAADGWPPVPESNVRCPLEGDGSFTCQLPATEVLVYFQQDPGFEENAEELKPDRVRAERLGPFEPVRAQVVPLDGAAAVDIGKVMLR